ncbi:MAG: hypothetical protein JO144_05495, partial [Actinobacteria bacterium]|nr:hypothetical protein [Actinomycetota bacterium]
RVLWAAVAPAALLLGVAPYLGMLWEKLAPAPTYINLGGSIYLNNQDTDQFLADDTWFLVLGLLAGLIAGALGYWRYRRGLPAMLGLTGAAMLGSLIARHVGVALGPPPIALAALGVPDGSTVHAMISLKAHAVLLAWPVGVLLAYVCLIAGLERPARQPVPDAEAAQADSGHAVEAEAAAKSVGAGGAREELGAGNGGDPVEDPAFPVEQAERRA